MQPLIDSLSLFFLPCEMPFKQAEEILEEKEVMGQKLLSSPFDVLLIALCRLQETVYGKSENFVLLSFTFEYTLGVLVTVLYHLCL